MGRIYSIDPGLNGTGWAAWSERRRPERVGVLKQPTPGNLAMRCHSIGESIKRIIKKDGALVPATHVFIEFPMAMAGSARGIAAQAGAVYKLTFLVGYIAASVWPCEVFTVTPMEWKGQLPKDVVVTRIQRMLGEEVCRELGIKTHAWDATGLGLWATGVWRD